MKLLTTFSVEFDAGHGEHGHHYVVKATCSDVSDLEVLAELEAIKGEFSERAMEVMLPATPAEPPYIAAYILERLRGNHPGVIEVEVRESGSESGIARHEQR